MAGKKRVHSESNSTYKLKLFRFTKQYDSKCNNGPKARSGHRIVCTEKSMYSIGGFNPQVSCTNPPTNLSGVNSIRSTGIVFHEIWRFDFDSKKWTKLTCKNMSTELASCATALAGNLLFLYGGTGIPFGVKINEEVSVCNLQAPDGVMDFHQINIEGFLKPPKQYGQSVAVRDAYLYTVGGTDGFVYSMDVHRLNLRTNIWEKLYDQIADGDGPTARYRQEIVLYKDWLIVLGGGTSELAFDLKNIPAFNLKSRRWDTFETRGDESMSDSYPDDRRCHVCVQNPQDPAVVFINGGVSTTDTFSDTWRLDLRTLQWTFMRSLHLPYGIYFHTGAATPDGKMVLFGGVVQEDGSSKRTSDVYTCWMTVPTLKRACWDAVLHYVHNGTIKVPANDIRSLGLSSEYEKILKQCL